MAKGYAGPGGSYNKWVPEIAGPQKKEKYSKTGKNYATFGEQDGFLYYPVTDSYIPDPNYQKKWAEDNGIAEKKKTLQDALLPIAATGAVVAGTQGLFSNPTGFITGIADGVGKLGGGLTSLGSGAASTGATTALPSAVASAAGGAVPAAPIGISATTLG